MIELAETTDDEYEEEMKQIRNMFPNAMFEIDIPLSEMNDVITNETNIIVTHTLCNCRRNTWQRELVFYVSGNNMTNKYIINELIKQGLNLDCDHFFLEGFRQISNTEFELVVGS